MEAGRVGVPTGEAGDEKAGPALGVKRLNVGS